MHEEKKPGDEKKQRLMGRNTETQKMQLWYQERWCAINTQVGWLKRDGLQTGKMTGGGGEGKRVKEVGRFVGYANPG